ncbi:MAG: RagB/SusD family nutrient uptake outer membrane protein [Chitinophagaceae bacterium]|nr:RagB/SusD family nutrient uptake outer membrane protein [Chitinophagaceae bacterium]
MKKIIISLIVLGSGIGFPSCKKALEENPKSFLSPDQFFKSDVDAVQGVNGVYSWLIGQHPARLFQQELWSYLDEDCDAIIQRNNSGDYNISPASFGNAQVIWNGLYRGIYAASQVIDKVPMSGTSALKDRSVAEARFLRALYNYYLMGLYRDAPMVTEKNYADISVTSSLPRATAAELRQYMIDDLTAAIAVLPASYTSAADKGRATKGAAQTLLAKVYLWNKDWSNAVTTAQSITGYTLQPEYADVFRSNNELNSEMIFEIDFQTDKLNSYQHAFYSPNANVGVEPFKSKAWYGTYIPLDSYANSFDPADKRKASIIATGYNGVDFTPDPVNNIHIWSGPKWWRLDAGERNSGLDIYLFRYADVLLMLAEAANENNDMGTAYDAINQVRERAGLAELSGLTQDQLREAIRQERAWELVGEGHRKLDLVRWGIWLERAKTAMAERSQLRAGSYQPQHAYFPVPDGEVQKNPSLLPQNEGY